MSQLEDLVAGAVVIGIDSAGPATVVTAQRHGTQAVTLVFRDASARVDERVLFRSDEGTFTVDDGPRRAWSFDGDGHLFRLVAEARRI